MLRSRRSAGFHNIPTTHTRRVRCGGQPGRVAPDGCAQAVSVAGRARVHAVPCLLDDAYVAATTLTAAEWVDVVQQDQRTCQAVAPFGVPDPPDASAAHGRLPGHPAHRGHPALKEGPGTMTVTFCLPATEVISIDAMASVDTVVWRCRLCETARHCDHPTHSALREHRAPKRPAPRHDRHGPQPGRLSVERLPPLRSRRPAGSNVSIHGSGLS